MIPLRPLLEHTASAVRKVLKTEESQDRKGSLGFCLVMRAEPDALPARTKAPIPPRPQHSLYSLIGHPHVNSWVSKRTVCHRASRS